MTYFDWPSGGWGGGEVSQCVAQQPLVIQLNPTEWYASLNTDIDFNLEFSPLKFGNYDVIIVSTATIGIQQNNKLYHNLKLNPTILVLNMSRSSPNLGGLIDARMCPLHASTFSNLRKNPV